MSIIAVDGSTASGKGTLCKALSAYYQYDLLDTGLLYRAIGKLCFDAQIDLDNQEKVSVFTRSLQHIPTDLPNLRKESVGKMGSQVAQYPAVRQALLEYQRRFGNNPPNGRGAILDGRDIGTVIFPDTPYKLFLSARAEIRAERRYQEMIRTGVDTNFNRILQDVKERDERDKNRKESPLIPAEDAFVLDTSELDEEQVFQKAIQALNSYGLER